jgi:Uma2 family endonuclease
MAAAVSASPLAPPFVWTRDAFLLAWDAGVFDGDRVELVKGRLITASIGDWHGDTATNAAFLLRADGVRVSSSSLVSGGSVPDPDCWVRREPAQPAESVSRRLSCWHAEDVLLVVEVGDETKQLDLTDKAEIYGAAGFPVYWVIHRDGVEEFTGPAPHGYSLRRSYRRGEQVPLPYVDGGSVSVDALIGEASRDNPSD